MKIIIGFQIVESHVEIVRLYVKLLLIKLFFASYQFQIVGWTSKIVGNVLDES